MVDFLKGLFGLNYFVEREYLLHVANDGIGS
ncbi:hypothetical protein JOC37_002055 [Desulfohalotomaculum tongense]|nr:hypothetical protein [Desulforadius tongensis]